MSPTLKSTEVGQFWVNFGEEWVTDVYAEFLR